jgi:opacity protein-like surface antigen
VRILRTHCGSQLRENHVETLKIGLSLALVSVCALPATSHAQADSVRLHLGAGVGVAGEAEAEYDDIDEEDQPDGADLAPTYGVHAGIEVPLHDYFTLGAEFGLSFWNPEDAVDPPAGVDKIDRQKQLDVLARPKLRLMPVEGLELYGVVPVGLTYYIPSSDLDEEEDGYKYEVDGGVGFAVGVSAGVTYFVTEHIGLTGEAGYLYRKFGTKETASGGGVSDSIEGKISFGQVQLRAGLAIAF